jgi:metal-dependent amidase/aminoacylase/carboxypeptidase family protein
VFAFQPAEEITAGALPMIEVGVMSRETPPLAAPGCYFVDGAAHRERGLDGAHHTAQFDFDETALTVAARVLGGATVRLLEG